MPLGKLILWRLGRKDWLKGIRIISTIPSLGTNGHWRRRKVLNLLKLEVKTLGLDSKVSHIFLMTSRMRSFMVHPG